MKYLKSLLLTAIVSLIIITPVFPQNILTIGNDAPAIKYEKWIKGKSIEQFEKGKIYVVEFWATWCAPCKETIPHLTEMAHKFKDKVTFIGTAIGERGPDEKSNIKLVTGFVEKMGDKMDYNVALDTKDGFMSKNWMNAAAQNGIPCAFIIDANSKIAWIGYPSEDMSNVLIEVIEGKYNNKLYADELLKSQKKQLITMKLMKRFKEVNKNLIEADKMKEYNKMIIECEKIVKDDPELSTMTDHYYAKALVATNPDKAIEAAEKASKSEDAILVYIEAFVNQKNHKKLYDYAINYCTQLLKNDSKNLQIIYMLFIAYDSIGDKEKAIETLERFISIARENNFDDNNLQEYINKLTELKNNK